MSVTGKNESVVGHGTGIWYCPNCGYVDPKTRDTRCPKCTRSPLFREPNYGYFIRIGPDDGDRG